MNEDCEYDENIFKRVDASVNNHYAVRWASRFGQIKVVKFYYKIQDSSEYGSA